MKTLVPKNFLPVLLILLLAAAGCENSDKAIVSQAADDTITIEDYFPLTAGKTVTFTVDNEVTGIVSSEKYTVGAGVSDGNAISYQWIHSYGNYADTGYFVRTGSALYYYENGDAYAELLFDAPLEIGKSWNRLTQSREGQNLIDSLIGNYDNKYGGYNGGQNGGDHGYKEDGELGFGGVGKNFPLTASSYLSITAIEDIELSNGETFEDCLRVESQAGSQYTNIYWYAPKYGLIKYILGATEESLATEDSPDGQVVGEMQ